MTKSICVVATIIVLLLFVWSAGLGRDDNQQLPNGCRVSSANDDCRYIVDATGTVIVDSHIKFWEVVDSETVQGILSTGLTFKLDTSQLVTNYSNGLTISRGEPVKVKDLPNEYCLMSRGNSQHIIWYGSTLVGPVSVYDVKVSDEIVSGVDEYKMKFEINTKTHFYKFQTRSGWAIKNEQGATQMLPGHQNR